MRGFKLSYIMIKRKISLLYTNEFKGKKLKAPNAETAFINDF